MEKQHPRTIVVCSVLLFLFTGCSFYAGFNVHSEPPQQTSKAAGTTAKQAETKVVNMEGTDRNAELTIAAVELD